LQAQLEGSEQGSKRLTRTKEVSLKRAMDRCEQALKRSPQTLDSVSDALKEYDKAQQVSSVASGLSILRTRIEEAFVMATQNETSSGNAKRAREIIAIARSRGWLTPDLLQVEQAMDGKPSGGAP
jgi:hypothetical protein